MLDGSVFFFFQSRYSSCCSNALPLMSVYHRHYYFDVENQEMIFDCLVGADN